MPQKCPKTTENDKVKKVTQIDARIIFKPHAHLQTTEKTCAKFQKDRYKLFTITLIVRLTLD